jgi:hypothetical protein
VSFYNLGDQVITFDFKHPAKSADFNNLLKDFVPPGIYKGGELSIVSGNVLAIAPFTAYLNVGTDKLIRVETRSTINLTILAHISPFLVNPPWFSIINTIF